MGRQKTPRNKNSSLVSLLKTSLKYHAGQYFDKSTLHGVRYIAENDRPFIERFMWFCLTTIGMTVTLIIIASLWEKFQTNPTITGLDTDFHHWEVPFPTITLCPDVPTNESLISDYVSKTWGHNSGLALKDSSSEYYIEFVKIVAQLKIENLQNIVKFSENSADSKSQIPTTEFENILYKVVGECPDVIFDCEWKGSAYNCCEGFTTVLTEMGFCYTFNSRYSIEQNNAFRQIGEDNFKPHLIRETDSKWSILLNMNNVKENNVHVYIHSADEIPTLEMASQHVWKGSINKIYFLAKHTYTTPDVQQLSIKQRHCIFPKEVKLLTASNYTYGACRMECRMKRARALCGCIPFFYKELADFPHCTLDGLHCLAKHLEELKHDTSCSCELGCMNTVYEVEKLNDAKEEDDTSLEIAFISWPMVRYKREVLFGWVDLLVSFGGIAGLFLGFSLLSGVEIIYYFTMRSCCMVYRNKDELQQLQEEYENQPQPTIDLSLTPYFLRPKSAVFSKSIEKKSQYMHNVPFLN